MGRNRSHYSVPDSLAPYYLLRAWFNVYTGRNEYSWECQICQSQIDVGGPAIDHLREHDIAATVARRLMP